MEHADFEHHIKTKLESRKIAPSTEAWNKLEVQLSTSTPSRKRKKIGYRVTAAAAVILLIGSVYMVNQLQYQTTNPPLENDNRISFPTYKTEISTAPDSSAIQEAMTKVVIPVEKDTSAEKPIRNIPEAIAHHNSSKDMTQEQIAQPSFEDQKIIEVVEKIQQLQQRKEGVSDTEIDLLLAQAQQEIKLRKKLTDTLVKVDAMTLLAGVEEELDQSFKEKVFETLKEGFQKVKTAVAERNH